MIPSTSDPETKFEIVAHEVKYSYPGEIEALKGIDLHIREGDYVALVGGNGSGKTTLAKTLNGLLRPSHGTVSVSGRPIGKMTVASIARYVGYAFQNPDHQLFCSSVDEEVAFGPRNLGYKESETKEKTEHAISIMGLQEIRDQAPLSLTLGLRRRVSIASVIAMDPRVMILDEPTTGLDANEIESLMENIALLNEEGHTIILITHDMKLVAEHARRVIVMANGRVMLDSDPRGVFSDLDVLRESSLEPPPVTLLAHRLSDFGVREDAIFPDELVRSALGIRGVR